ncbi:Retrovirus-related Pol polyprotein from transposon 17.6 [Trichinella nelsoni]|uniref:RNA-directed DNA polymerase n=1 Tax=Trichinella nelsoni TaxID=6336 RepID=A0A0V0RNS0_9BILA|nr:Retrovirus-related Pol polyprotein from transposon 17.6 [Trichinella nelsoni]
MSEDVQGNISFRKTLAVVSVRAESPQSELMAYHAVQKAMEKMLPSEQESSGKHRSVLTAILWEFADVLSTSDEDVWRTGVVRHAIYNGDAKPVRCSPRRIPYHQRAPVEALLDVMLRQDVVEPSILCRLPAAEQPHTEGCEPAPEVRQHFGPAGGCTMVFDPGPGKRILAGGGLTTRSGEDGLHHPLWAVPVQSDALWTVQRTSHKTCHHGDSPERPGGNRLLGVPVRCHRIWQDCRRAYGTTARGVPLLPGSGFEGQTREMTAHKEEGSLLGPHHFGKRDRYGPKRNLCRAGVAGTDLRVRVAQFLGLVSYYRKFVNGFANVAAPLHLLLENEVVWDWSKACQSAVDALNLHLSSAPILTYPDFHRQFIVDVDASGDNLGAVLSQKEGKAERVVAYASRTLTKAKRCYCATRREMHCLVWALREFRPYLYGQRFVVRTDHSCLRWLTTFKEPEGQVARWLESLAELDFEKGVHAPSRLPNSEVNTWRRALKTSCVLPSRRTQRSNYCGKGWLARTGRWDVPRSVALTCMCCSSNGAARRWCREPSETKSYCQCTTVVVPCTHGETRRKGPTKNNRAPMHSMAAGYPLQRVGMDILGPLQKNPSENRYVLVLTDYFTKWTAAFPLANMVASTVDKVLVEKYIAYFGAPDYLHSDHGRSFEASVVPLLLEMCRLFGIKKTRSSRNENKYDKDLTVQ